MQWRQTGQGDEVDNTVVLKEARIDFPAVICTDCNIISFVYTNAQTRCEHAIGSMCV